MYLNILLIYCRYTFSMLLIHIGFRESRSELLKISYLSAQGIISLTQFPTLSWYAYMELYFIVIKVFEGCGLSQNPPWAEMSSINNYRQNLLSLSQVYD
jgi:hypothetical protein